LIFYAAADRPRPPAWLARLSAGLALVATLGACSSAVQNSPPADRLLNPFLGPTYSQWLVGPIARLATAEEMDAYLALRDDDQARAFVEQFWERRDPAPLRPDNPLRKQFDERAAEADRRFLEGGLPGRRTDRGTIWVLFGPPEDTDYEISPEPRDPPIEVWTYPAAAEPGLSGERPAEIYRFIKRDELTVFYIPRSVDRRLRDIDRF